MDRTGRGIRGALRRGERPAIKEYIHRYPEIADLIRELFPALVKVEQARGFAAGRREGGGEVVDCSRSVCTGRPCLYWVESVVKLRTHTAGLW